MSEWNLKDADRRRWSWHRNFNFDKNPTPNEDAMLLGLIETATALANNAESRRNLRSQRIWLGILDKCLEAKELFHEDK